MSMATLVRVPLTLAAALAFHASLSPPTAPAPPISSLRQPGDRRTVRAAARFIAVLLTKVRLPTHTHARARAPCPVLIGLVLTTRISRASTGLRRSPTRSSCSHPTSPPPSLAFPSPPEALLAWIKNPTNLSLDSSLLSSLTLPSSITSAAIAGTTLAIIGAFLRLAAYDALGQFYACPNPGPNACEPPALNRGKGHAHALIVTGPYAFVRHPGYAGLVLCTTGLALSHFGSSSGTWPWPLSWASACISSEPALLAANVSAGVRSVALTCAVLITVAALRRIAGEERALRTRFKGEWEAWTRVVRYKLVPGIY